MGGDKGQLTAEDGQESEERAGRGTKQAAHVNRRHFRLIMKRFSERLRVAAGVWLPSQNLFGVSSYSRCVKLERVG